MCTYNLLINVELLFVYINYILKCLSGVIMFNCEKNYHSVGRMMRRCERCRAHGLARHCWEETESPRPVSSDIAPQYRKILLTVHFT